MGLEFLARVRRTSIAIGLVAGLMATTYFGPGRGLALLAGCAWCLINLVLLENLIVAVTGEARGTQQALVRSIVSGAGMMGLFAAGAFLALRLPPTWLLAGFGIPFAVMVLKAASLMLLPTRLWRRITASPWRAATVCVSGSRMSP